MSMDTASDATTANLSSGATWMSLLPMVMIFVIFYFFLIRPQVKKQKEVEQMISDLKKGDQVVAAGGICGVITKIEDNLISLEIAENTKIKVTKSSVTELLSKEKKTLESDLKKSSPEAKTKKHKKIEKSE